MSAERDAWSVKAEGRDNAGACDEDEGFVVVVKERQQREGLLMLRHQTRQQRQATRSRTRNYSDRGKRGGLRFEALKKNRVTS